MLLVSGTLGIMAPPSLTCASDGAGRRAVQRLRGADAAYPDPAPAERVKALRDATRGGVNAVAHEFAAASGCGIELQEATLPVNDTVRGVCELLGLDALNFANEGKLVLAVARDEAENVLAHLRSHALGRDAAIIGEVVVRPGVRSVGLYGVKRTLDLPHAEPLPRIC